MKTSQIQEHIAILLLQKFASQFYFKKN